jgi:ATP-dependent Clp protease ATP-binding subunit ClpX
LTEKGSVCRLCGRSIEGNDYIVMKEGNVCNVCTDSIVQMRACINEFDFDMKSDCANTGGMKKTADAVGLKPLQIKEMLDQYIVGQEHAKKVLSVACYNHYKRNELQDNGIKKSNVLMVGPTGSGKTYLVETLAKILNVPVAMAASTTLTEAGYIGDDVESVVKKLLDAADGDVKKAEKGIIFIDEIDKLSGKSSETEKKVGGKGVQQALLRLLEGTIVSVDKSGEPRNQGFKINIDTSGILFICGGAFPEVEQIIKKRITKKTSIGFNAEVAKEEVSDVNMLLNITVDDLREFGLIPEFIGRLPIIASLENTSVEMLKRILLEPKDSIISQYHKLFKFDDTDITFEESALELIAEKAFAKGTGARSLRGILEELLLDVMFNIPSMGSVDSVHITRAFVEGKEKPYYHEKTSDVSTSYA